MPFSKSHPFRRCLRRLYSSPTAAAANELLPWLPPPERKRSAIDTPTSCAAPAVVTNHAARRAVSKKGAADDPKQLFALFSQAARQPGFRHDHPSYKSLVSRLARLDDGSEAVRRILSHISAGKLPPRPAILVALIDVLAAYGFPIELLGLLLTSAPVVHEKVFAKLMGVLVETGRLGTARSLFSNGVVISRLGFPLRVRHYIGVVRAYCERGEAVAAVQLLDEMSQRGCVPDVFCYGAVIAGICRFGGSGAVDDAVAVVEQMWRVGREPDSVVYNTLVHGCVTRGEMERAEGIVREMEGSGVGCDAGTYNTLIGGIRCGGGAIAEGVKVLRRMMEKGVAPDAVTFTALFSWMRREGRAPETSAPLGLMVKMGIRTGTRDVNMCAPP